MLYLVRCFAKYTLNNTSTDNPEADDTDEAAYARRVLDLLTRKRTTAQDAISALGLSADELVHSLMQSMY